MLNLNLKHINVYFYPKHFPRKLFPVPYLVMTIDESLIYNEQTYGHKIQLKVWNEIKENLQIFIYLHILD